MKIKKAYILPFLLIVTSEKFLYLTNSNLIENVSLLVIMAWCGYVMLNYRNFPRTSYRFGYLMAFPVILMLTSSLQSYLLYGQSMWLGIRPQRYWIIFALCYFPLSKLWRLGKITTHGMEKLIYMVGTMELILYSVQYILGDRFNFLSVHTYSTYSSKRYYFSNILLCLILFVSMNEIFNRRKVLKNSVYILWILFVILQVEKMRMTTIAVSTALIVGIFIWRRGGNIKMGFIVCVIIAGFIAANSEVIQSIIPALIGTGRNDTLQIREVGRTFYLSVLIQHPLLGGGYINTQHAVSLVSSRYNEGIYWVDNGIFGFSYLNGGLGLAWVIALIAKIIRNGQFLRKRINNYVFVVMPIYWIVAMISEAHWYFSSFLVVVLLVCFEESIMNNVGDMDEIE